MERSTEAALPPLYAAWLREVAGGPIPAETVATCEECVMLPRAGGPSAEHYFVPETKCCAFEPTLPNYLAGRILADSDAALARGRAALEERVARRVLAAPSGVRSGGLFRTLYAQTPDVFGRAPALRCPYLGPDGGCGVWRHRPGVCATWFCKHVRGQAGARFWRTADRLLRAVELDLSVWCIAELDAPATELLSPGPHADGRPDVAELGGPLDAGRHGALWDAWEGREAEFYRECARLVEPLGWPQVLAICGPSVRVLAEATRAAYQRLVSDELPPRLRLARLELHPAGAGRFLVSTYSPYDPQAASDTLLGALRCFDGRPTGEALEAVRRRLGLGLSPGLVRRLVDFGLLEPVEDAEPPPAARG